MLRRTYIFLSLTILFLLLAGGALSFLPKGELHLLLCDHHTAVADFFFRYYTQVGEWVPYVICAGLLLYRYDWAIFTLSGVALSGLTTQVVKHLVDAPRPLTWFATHMPEVTLPLVEGVPMSNYFSFPSGHTTTFFALFLALSILLYTPQKKSRNIMLQTLFFLLALLGAYSRIYLSQHFLLDTVGGAAIGCIITLLLYPLMARWLRSESQAGLLRRR